MSFARYPNYKDSGVEWLGEVPGHWGSVHSSEVLMWRLGKCFNLKQPTRTMSSCRI